MYRCDDCGFEFEEPKEYEDFVGYYGSQRAYQTIYLCPECGSDDFFELTEEEED